ncbi:hypothetical protein IV203_010338 [Nitzschia inconspicua]|uniref:Uncharacterized protein n=1 Tax=Nitzschia inconspicua TaxID=303405 RepID=A0A9K3KW07_9STRA|nr:hypothetical protein IV203_010338 [Nitzschia inconspicua]
MIPTSNEQQDRYSVVVLDYPRRDKQDIECYCIPSSNLEDHGYIPHGEISERRDDSSVHTASSSGRPPQHPSSSLKGGRVWSRLWARNKADGNARSSRRLRANQPKKELTEAEATKYISSQDDLDWSTNDNFMPANPNPRMISRIVQPLVQIYIEDGKEEVDDTISVMSHDTCWQDDSQAVVELVLPNVLFCDKRDDSEKRDVESWNILFPSYIEECRENARDDAATPTPSNQKSEEFETSKEELAAHAESNHHFLDDDGSISSGGWEDAVTETESEADEPVIEEIPVDPLSAGPASMDVQTQLDGEISPLECDHPCERQNIEVEIQRSKLPPSDLLLPPLQHSLPPIIEQQLSDPDLQPAPSVLLPAGKMARPAPSPIAVQRKLIPSLKKNATTSHLSPKRFSRRSNNKNLSSEEPLPQNLNRPGLFRTSLKSLGPNYSPGVKEPLEPTTCDVKEIDVLSESSQSSNLTNPSMFSSATWSPPPSPPKNSFRAQRRGSVTKFSLHYPYSSSAAEVSTSPDKGAKEMDCLGSNLSAAGSQVIDNQEIGALVENTTHTSFVGGLLRRLLEIPSNLLRRKENKPSEEKSSGGSAAANYGDNATASWASISLKSLGGFSSFEDCEEGPKWWEVGSSFLIDQVPCSITDQTMKEDNSIDEANNDTLTCDSQTTVFEDANEESEQGPGMGDSPLLEESEEVFFVDLMDHSAQERAIASADDPWSAAKRGDVHAIQKWTNDESYDWSQKDEFGNTALFYACHSGAATNIAIVKQILDQWPLEEIPADVFDRCKLNAINSSVIRMLKHPEEAEKIVFSDMSKRECNQDELILKEDDESLHLSKWLLYDVEEGDEEGDY